MFPVVVYRPDMLGIMADMDQKDSTMRPEINSNDFGGFLELISRFEFEFRRRENFFLNDSNFWCVHVNVPWPFCAHAIPFRMLWLL